MTKIRKNESADKQMEYAKIRIFSDKKPNKKKAALQVGYTESTACSAISKIESKPGYQNAVTKLAKESNALALDIMDEFKRRGVTDFSNKDLIGALNAIGAAWTRFNAPPRHNDSRDPMYDNGKNRLRTVILQRVENQTIATPTPEVAPLPTEDAEF